MVQQPNVEDFTVPEKILLAADHLDRSGQTTFTAEMLIVTSWEKFPKTFGLKGFVEKYPDSNKILSSIMGEKGLARRGWLIKVGQKLYSLTREGRSVVRRVMLQEEETPANNAKRLSRDQERFVLGLLESTAFQKFEENRKSDLTFADACRYWGVTENMKGELLDQRIDHLERTLLELDRSLSEADASVTGGRIVAAGDIRVLTNIHRYMEDRFDRHLNLLRTRSGKR